MRPPPTFEKLDVPFGGDPFPARATIALAYNDGTSAGPAREITVLAGRQGTWTIVFTPQARIPQGAQIALRKVENEFRFAYRHQHYWPDASNYVTVEDGAGSPLPFACDTCLKSAVWAVVRLPRDFEAGEPVVVRMGDQRHGGTGSTTWSTTYQRARVAAGVRLPGEEWFHPCPEATVSVGVVPCPPVSRYYLFAPSTVPAGTSFSAVALPVDVNGNPISASQQVEVTAPEGEHLTAARTPSRPCASRRRSSSRVSHACNWSTPKAASRRRRTLSA